MKKIVTLLLATLLVFAGCKATDPKDAFFSALERYGEIKNTHEVASVSLVMDNEGSPYTFMDVQLEGDVSMETYDMAVKYDFSLMDIGMKMELYKKGEDALFKMPIIAKYIQLPSELFDVYSAEEIKSLQDLVVQESKALYEQMGESLQISKKGSDVVASFEMDGAATKSFLTDVLVNKFLKNPEIREKAVEQSFQSQKKTWEEYGLAEDFTEEDWVSMREEAAAAYDEQIDSYCEIIEKMEISSLKGQSTVGKDGFFSSSEFELKFSLYGTPMTMKYNASLSNINKVEEIAFPGDSSNTIKLDDISKGNVSMDDLNPFFGMIQRMKEEGWEDWTDSQDDFPTSVPLPETGTPARPSL